MQQVLGNAACTHEPSYKTEILSCVTHGRAAVVLRRGLDGSPGSVDVISVTVPKKMESLSGNTGWNAETATKLPATGVWKLKLGSCARFSRCKT